MISTRCRPSKLPWHGFGPCRCASFLKPDKPRRTASTAHTQRDCRIEDCSRTRPLRGYHHAIEQKISINAISPGNATRRVCCEPFNPKHAHQEDMFWKCVPIGTIAGPVRVPPNRRFDRAPYRRVISRWELGPGPALMMCPGMWVVSEARPTRYP